MLIGIYSDSHIDQNDKVLSLSNSHNVFESVIWARKTFKEEGCEIIINDGDFLNSDVIDSHTNYLISQIYKNNKQKEYLILGNHEKKDAEGVYNALSLLSLVPKLEVVNELATLPIGEDTVLVFQPYFMKKDWKDLCKVLDENKGKKRILFSHLGFNNIPNITSKISGEIDYNLLKNRVERIFNGHIHIALESGKFVQIGTVSGLNFGDDYTFHRPGIIIYNTETDEVKRIENPKAILYQKCKYNELSVLRDLERTHLRVDCPANKVEEVNKEIEKLNCLSCRVNVLLTEGEPLKEGKNKVEFNLYTEPSQALYDFYKTDKTIFSDEQIKTFIDEYIKVK